jgi:hypothetical protein
MIDGCRVRRAVAASRRPPVRLKGFHPGPVCGWAGARRASGCRRRYGARNGSRKR